MTHHAPAQTAEFMKIQERLERLTAHVLRAEETAQALLARIEIILTALERSQESTILTSIAHLLEEIDAGQKRLGEKIDRCVGAPR